MYDIWETGWYYKSWKQNNILIGGLILNKEMRNLFGTNINGKMSTLFMDGESNTFQIIILYNLYLWTIGNIKDIKIIKNGRSIYVTTWFN